MRLYQLDELIRNFQFEIDEETGEILNFDALEGLKLERERKLENLAVLTKELRAEADAITNEMKSLKARADSTYNKADRIEDFIAHELNGEELSSERVKVSWRKSERVEIDDIGLIPQKYLTQKVDTKPDKTSLKKAIKGGEQIDGCHIEEYNNIKIV